MSFCGFDVVSHGSPSGRDGFLVQPTFIDIAEVAHMPRQQFDLEPAEPKRVEVCDEVRGDGAWFGENQERSRFHLGAVMKSGNNGGTSRAGFFDPVMRQPIVTDRWNED